MELVPRVLRSRPSRGTTLRLAVLVLAVTGALLVAGLVELPTAEQLRLLVAGAGLLGVLGFVGGYAVAALVPIPKSILSLAAGLVFGVGWGTVAVLVGAVLGAWLAFLLARWIGHAALSRHLDAHVPAVRSLLSRRGLLPVLGLRIVPVVPFTAMNYAAGVSPVRQRDYLLGTALGIVPGTLTYVTLGAYGTQPGSWMFALAAGAAVLFGGLGWFLTRRARARRFVQLPAARPA